MSCAIQMEDSSGSFISQSELAHLIDNLLRGGRYDLTGLHDWNIGGLDLVNNYSSRSTLLKSQNTTPKHYVGLSVFYTYSSL